MIYDFLNNTRWEDIPPSAQAMAKRCLLDLIRVGAAGRSTDLSRIICDHAVDEFGTTGPRMLFDGRRTSASGAAMAGGMTIDAFDAHLDQRPCRVWFVAGINGNGRPRG